MLRLESAAANVASRIHLFNVAMKEVYRRLDRFRVAVSLAALSNTRYSPLFPRVFTKNPNNEPRFSSGFTLNKIKLAAPLKTSVRRRLFIGAESISSADDEKKNRKANSSIIDTRRPSHQRVAAGLINPGRPGARLIPAQVSLRV